MLTLPYLEFTNLIRALFGDMIIKDVKGTSMSLQSAQIDLVAVNDVQKAVFEEIEYAVKALKEKEDSGIRLTAEMVPVEFKDKDMLKSGTVVVKEVERMSAQVLQQIDYVAKSLDMASASLRQFNNRAPQHLSPPPSPVRTTALESSDDNEEPRDEIPVPNRISAGKRKSNTTPVIPVTKKPRKDPVKPRKAPVKPRKAPVKKTRTAPVTKTRTAPISKEVISESDSGDDISDQEMWKDIPSETSNDTSAQEHIPVSSECHSNVLVPIQSCQNPESTHAQEPIPTQIEMTSEEHVEDTSAQEHIPVSSECHSNVLVPIQSCQNPESTHAQEPIPNQIEITFEELVEDSSRTVSEHELQSAVQFLENFNAKEINTPP